MIITINNHEFNTNPSGAPKELLFEGTVHTGTGLTEKVYGWTEEEVFTLAGELKQLNKDFNTLHVYSPGERLHIGTLFL